MNLERMRERCARDQWKVDDLDWSLEPRVMGAEEERTVVQYFTDMAGIEMLAGELFRVQRDRTSDPLLRDIFTSFIVDEQRHAAVATRLAQHYDVHHYQDYKENPHLTRFRPYFVAALKELSAEIANAYITGGELMLDVALLRSLNDYVHDAMSEQAMELINRDESRHIAMDFHMIEFYASEDYQRWLAMQPRTRLRDLARASWALANMLRHAAPFFQDVFFTPLKHMDPSGKRMREAYKRLQLVSARDRVRDRPFWRAVTLGREVFTHPLLGPAVGKLARRVAGVPEALMVHLYDDRELEAARHASIEAMADEAVGMKYSA
jgi:hypothetical protein